MQAIAMCINNLEFITQNEIKEILKISSDIVYSSRVMFNVKTDKDLAKFIYYSRSIIKAYLLIEKLEFKSSDEIMEKIKKLNFPYMKDTFVVRCERKGTHDFSSNDIEREAGEIIFSKSKLKVSLDDATTTIIIDIIDNICFIGIDFTGIPLTKREYRIKLATNPLNAVLAHCMLKIGEYEYKNSLLDPFCKSGEIPIEAVLYALSIPNFKTEKLFFNKLIKTNFKDKKTEKDLEIYAADSLQNNLKSGEINARILSLQKSIKFSRVDIEWLDTKFKENSIDKVITFPIYPTSTLPIKIVEKIYKELFYHLEFIMKKKRSVVILTPVPELIERYASQHSFKKQKEINLNYMNQQFTILKFI